ncbi:MAG: ABC transporter substrate-binding protein [Actinomycetia bacterium]|nr:ABC transporter substrate-binding protein [Actinomycetes bacterium]
MPIRPLPTLLLALLLAAFASPAAAQGNGDGVVVRIGLHAAENNLNPFIVPQAQPISHDLTMLVYDTLFWSQSRLDPDPWLATGAEASDDFRTWTVTLRDDVLWHDGEAFTADDVAFTFQYFSDVGGPGRYGRHVYQHPVFESATVIDDTTVQLSFVDPVATFKLLPGGDLPILPRHIWEGVDDPRADATSLPIGTGPYKMVDYQPDSSYRFEANQAYFLGTPLVDTLVMSVIPDDGAAFAALEAGELDFVARNVPVALTEQIERNDELDIVGGNRNQTVYLMFDMTKPGLDDRQVRRSVSLALDSDALLNTVEGGMGRLGTDTWTHPSSPWTRDPEAAHLSDLVAANQLLDAAGYSPGGDGVRLSPDGQPLSFALGVNASLPNHLWAADLVAEQLNALGVTIAIEPLDMSAITAARGADAAGSPPIDMLIDELESHAQDDPDHLYFLFHSTGGGVGDVFGNYANPDFDGVVESTLGQPETVRRPLIHQAQEILAEDIPVVVLYYPAGRTAYRPEVYDGWWSDEGHGVFTKRAFLADYADVGDDSDVRDQVDSALEPIVIPSEDANADDGASRAIVGITIAAVGAAAAVGIGLLRRRGNDEELVD